MATRWVQWAQRAALVLQGDPNGERAWQRAASDASLAEQLVRARISVPCTRLRAPTASPPQSVHSDGVNEVWQQQVQHIQRGPEAHRASAVKGLSAWLQALPSTAEGQYWRQRTLWAAVEPHAYLPAFDLALQAGADPLAHASWSGMHGNLLAMVLTRGREEPATTTEALQTVVDACVQRGAGLDDAVLRIPRRLYPLGREALQVLMQAGMTVQTPAVAARWLHRYVAPPPLLGGPLEQALDSCAFLLEQGAPVDSLNAQGQTPLHTLLYSHQATTRESVQGLLRWFDFWVTQGADLQARTDAGDTLLHMAMANVHGPILPVAIFQTLVEALPDALDTPYREGMGAVSCSTHGRGKTPRMMLMEVVKGTRSLSLTGAAAAAQELGHWLQAYASKQALEQESLQAIASATARPRARL